MSKRIIFKPDDLIKRMNKDLEKTYQIGLHQIGVFGTKESKAAVRKNNPLTYIRKLNLKTIVKAY